MDWTPSQIEITFRKILRLIEDGTPVRQILGTKGMPTRRRFYDWIEDDEKMRERYARAKEIAAEAIFDEMVEIARTPLDGKTVERGPKGKTVKIGDMLGHRTLLINTLKWRLMKEAPKRFGEKLDVTSDNAAINLPAIVGMSIKNTKPANDSDDQTPGAED